MKYISKIVFEALTDAKKQNYPVGTICITDAGAYIKVEQSPADADEEKWQALGSSVEVSSDQLKGALEEMDDFEFAKKMVKASSAGYIVNNTPSSSAGYDIDESAKKITTNTIDVNLSNDVEIQEQSSISNTSEYSLEDIENAFKN